VKPLGINLPLYYLPTHICLRVATYVTSRCMLLQGDSTWFCGPKVVLSHYLKLSHFFARKPDVGCLGLVLFSPGAYP